MKPLVIICLHLTLTTLHSYADQSLIDATCRNTPNYRLCTATLHADRAATAADVTGLALIMVRAVRDKTRAAIAGLNMLGRRSSGHPKLSHALQECVRVYNAVMVADVPEAVEALTKGDPKFAENGMADVVVEAETCDSGAEAVAAVRRMNRGVSDLAQVARAVIRNLL